MNDIKTFTSELLGETYCSVVHKSGLKIYVFPKDMCTTYGILSVNFGGNVTEYQKDGRTVKLPGGCAHFLEHKLFDNPDGSNADDVFSSLGAYSNAYTSNDRTAYIFSTTENVRECLAHLVYFVTNPYFTDKTVEKEIGIIAEEIRGCLDDPYDRCYLNMLDGMYFENPVKNEICGSEASIMRITPEILYSCCKDFYDPSNMMLCLCGRIDVDTVLQVVDEILHTDGADAPVVKSFYEPREVRQAYTEKQMQVGKPLFAIGIKDSDIPADPTERYRKSEAVNILLHVMFSQSGEFYSHMLEEGLISPGFDFGYSCSASTAYVMISGESDDPKRLLSKIKEHITISCEKGIDIRDFEREKKCMYSSYISDFDSSEDIAFALSSYANEKIDLFAYTDIIDSIDLDYTMALMRKLFKDEFVTMSVIKP